jgi:mono/diheme cytochrome c family protein
MLRCHHWGVAAALFVVGLLLVLGLGACSERNRTSAPAAFAPVGPAIDVPTPTSAQLAEANPFGDAVQRGAAVYFALSCEKCHGAIGNAPGQLGLRGGGAESLNAVRRGRAGMPAYSTTQLSDAQAADLAAYLGTLAGQQQGLPPGQFQPVATPPGPGAERLIGTAPLAATTGGAPCYHVSC